MTLRRIDDEKPKQRGYCKHCWEPLPRGMNMHTCDGCKACAKINGVYPIPIACIMPWLFKDNGDGF